MTDSFRDAYLEVLQRLTDPTLDQSARRMGIHRDGEELCIPCFDHAYRVKSEGIVDEQGGAPTDALGLVLCRYILGYPAEPAPQGRKITFRELGGAGPLVSSFVRNTNKIISSTYYADANALKARCIQLHGRVVPSDAGFDVDVRFQALPAVPLYLQFNAAADLFPAQTTLLFAETAERYLDMQSLFILGTYLAGRLISQGL